MFEFWRDRGLSEQARQQEALSAYLDDALAPAEREKMEAQLAASNELRAQLQQMRVLRQEMRSMPRRRVPRNFTLDPALYGRPQRSSLANAYPILRTATALTAFLFVIALVANLTMGDLLGGFQAAAPAVVTRVVTETVVLEMAESEIEPTREMAVIQEEAEVVVQPTSQAFILEDESIVTETIVEEGPAAAEEAALLPTEPPEFSDAVEIIAEEAAESAPGSSAAGAAEMPAEAEAIAPPEAEILEPPPAAEIVEGPALEAEAPARQAPAAEPVPDAQVSSGIQTWLPDGFTPLLIALGVLFVLLAALTLVARSRL